MPHPPPHKPIHHISSGQKKSLGKRICWMILIWTASVFLLGLASLLIKLLMKMAGFHQ
jgi:hypothetical protein